MLVLMATVTMVVVLIMAVMSLMTVSRVKRYHFPTCSVMVQWLPILPLKLSVDSTYIEPKRERYSTCEQCSLTVNKERYPKMVCSCA